MRFLKQYGLCLLVFLTIDAVWLGIIAPRFYFSHLGELVRPTPLWTAAALFYALYLFGIVWFAVRPAIKAGSAKAALTQGALLGLFAYGTYDLTNWATIVGWPAIVVVVDIAWGTFLTGLTAFGTTWIWLRQTKTYPVK